ncbi:MAG: DUF389 domain-containing protein [Solirubrobacterales bacterium]
MLRMRVAVPGDRAATLGERLESTGGVHRLVRSDSELRADGIVLSADVDPVVADEVVAALDELCVEVDDYVLVRQEVIAPSAIGRPRRHGPNAFAWFELMGEARANARPIARYLALMAVAGAIAALGVLEDNSILIVGAMAVSPDLLPICATCVGIVSGRPPLVRRAGVTLLIGLLLVTAVALALTAPLDLLGILGDSFELGDSGLGSLASIDYSTVLVALAAGVAAILSFETRASAAVGVAISVTTIPAAGFLGVALALGDATNAGGAALVLAVNVILLIVSGSITLAVQHALATRDASEP